MNTNPHGSREGHGRVSFTLFLCLFAAQSAVIVMSPVLVEAAVDLDVSTATAGQLRTLAGLAAGIAALLVAPLSIRLGLGRQLVVAAALLAAGSAASAAAPTFAVLLLAQVPVGAAVGVLTTAGTLASAEWVAPELRARALAWALVGQPAAWIVGMPLIGMLGGISWRVGWLVLPLAAAVAAGGLVARRAASPATVAGRASIRSVLADRTLASWLAAEIAANAAWAGTLVYAGALFVESYRVSTGSTGWLLAVAAAVYVIGNLAARRLVDVEARGVLALLSLLLALSDGAFGLVRAGVVTSTLLFSAAAFLAGGRTLVSSAFALSRSAELRPTAASLRAATMQLGYFVGSSVGGAALVVGGYGTLGAAMGGLFASSALALGAGMSWTRSAPALSGYANYRTFTDRQACSNRPAPVFPRIRRAL
jgi:DHA1 family inner membrane transport protein